MANWNVSEMPEVTTAEKIQTHFDLQVPVLFLASGGSALSVLNMSKLQPYGGVTLAVMDERYTTDPARSNSLQVEKTELYKTVLAAGGRYLSAVPFEGESMPDWSTRFEAMVRTWRRENPNGKVVALFGMGNDAHTAGIFPEVFPTDTADAWFRAYTVPPAVHPETMRMTATPHFITSEVDVAIGFVLGTEKALVYAQAQKMGDVTKAPVLLWDEVPEVQIVSDVPLAE